MILQTLKYFKSHSLLLVVGLFYAYLLFHSVSGSRGMFKLAQYDSDIERLQAGIARVQGERLTLERRADLLRSSQLSRDALDERARDIVSVSHAKDIVIILDDRP